MRETQGRKRKKERRNEERRKERKKEKKGRKERKGKREMAGHGLAGGRRRRLEVAGGSPWGQPPTQKPRMQV